MRNVNVAKKNKKVKYGNVYSPKIGDLFFIESFNREKNTLNHSGLYYLMSFTRGMPNVIEINEETNDIYVNYGEVDIVYHIRFEDDKPKYSDRLKINFITNIYDGIKTKNFNLIREKIADIAKISAPEFFV